MNIKSAPKVTKDRNANEKVLRRLDSEGRIELYINDMELPESGSKISKRNSLPLGFRCSNKNCKCHDGVGGFGDGSDKFPDSYWLTPDHEKVVDRIKTIKGVSSLQDRRDCKQLFHHYINERDIFVTEDDGILKVSKQLRKELGIIVKSPSELEKRL